MLITFFILNVRSFNIILDTYKTFHVFSSLNLNKTKSEAAWLGIAKHSKEMPIECTWINLVNDKLKLLGLYYNYDQRLVNIAIQNGFIWNNKRRKIKHTALIADHIDGGYSRVDVLTYLISVFANHLDKKAVRYRRSQMEKYSKHFATPSRWAKHFS